jgi:hypothetical protein
VWSSGLKCVSRPSRISPWTRLRDGG